MRRLRPYPAAAALACLALLSGPRPAPAQPDFTLEHPVGLFRDMLADTVTSGIGNHFAPTPSLRFRVRFAGGDRPLLGNTTTLVAFDVDNDGDVDLLHGTFATRPDEPAARLLLNPGDGVFVERPDAGVPSTVIAAAAADLDNDGWTDLVAVVPDPGAPAPRRWDLDGRYVAPARRVVLLRNRQGRFAPFAPAEAPGVAPAVFTAFTLADFDADGWLDLVVATSDRGTDHRLSLCRGGPGGFAEADRGAIPRLPPMSLRKEIRLSAADPDEDGDPDLLLNECTGFPPVDRPVLWLENRDGALAAPADLGLSCTRALAPPIWFDADGDARLDAFLGVADFDGGANELHLAAGPLRWRECGRDAGLHAGYNYTNGLAVGDWDDDGFLDLLQARSFNEGRYTTSALFLNRAGRDFVNATRAVEGALGPGARAAVAADVDRDGDLDVVLGPLSDYLDVTPVAALPLKVLVNESVRGRWLGVALEGRTVNRCALGARVTVHAGDHRGLQVVPCGLVAHAAQPPFELHFGLGARARADSVVVDWGPGKREVWHGLEAGRVHRLSEGSAGSAPSR